MKIVLLLVPNACRQLSELGSLAAGELVSQWHATQSPGQESFIVVLHYRGALRSRINSDLPSVHWEFLRLVALLQELAQV